MKVHARARLRGLRKRLGAVTRPLRRGGPIVVYQMGKVGSSTVYRSLRALDLPRAVHHVHLLHELDELEERVRARYPDPAETLAQIEKGRALRAQLLRSDRPTSLVTLVRDPVQRNVSAFFENLTEVVPDAYERRARGDMPVSEILHAFVDRYDHEAPLTWFQSQLEPVFGIDVFATPFDTKRGFATYETPAARLLLVRLEDLERCGEAAIRQFLGLDHFRLVAANVGREKRYRDMYAEFQRSATLPEPYLTRMYDSRFARHFYSDAEIAGFRRRWTKADV